MNPISLFLIEKIGTVALLGHASFSMDTPHEGWQSLALILMFVVGHITQRNEKLGWYPYPKNAVWQVHAVLLVCLLPTKALGVFFIVHSLWTMFADPVFMDRSMAIILITSVLLREAALMLLCFCRWQYKRASLIKVREMVSQARGYLISTKQPFSLSLLDDAANKAASDTGYAKEFEEALCHGSTIELREVLSVFGDYLRSDYSLPPEQRHVNRVNGIDNAMHYVKLGEVQDGIDFYNGLHNS
tara:strand:- start:73 stop:804 length:732 start_codon:yes stop_codon:yes gene_type:complete